MEYYIGNMAFDADYLEHYGVKGMKWGKHRVRKNIVNAIDSVYEWWTGEKALRNANDIEKNRSYYRRLAVQADKANRDWNRTQEGVTYTTVPGKYDQRGRALIAKQYPDGAQKTYDKVEAYKHNPDVMTIDAFKSLDKSVLKPMADDARKRYFNAPRQVIDRTKKKGERIVNKVLSLIKR